MVVTGAGVPAYGLSPASRVCVVAVRYGLVTRSAGSRCRRALWACHPLRGFALSPCGQAKARSYKRETWGRFFCVSSKL